MSLNSDRLLSQPRAIAAQFGAELRAAAAARTGLAVAALRLKC